MAASRKTRSKVGVIGLGIIGTRVAANLRSAGHQVYVWSRTPRAAPNFLGSVVEVADLCDVIQLFVSDDGALQETIRTVAAALSHRHVVLCHATVSPTATRQAAGVVESQGARYLDAPFTGSKAAAQNRQLVYYIGGGKNALEEARPVLEATSKAILHVGGIGDAAVLKIATNLLTASTVQTLSEALALVRAAGIDSARLAEALESNASRSGTTDLKLPAMIAGNFEPNFSLKHMLKDVRFAQELADHYELSLPVADTTAEVLSLGMQNGWSDQDFSAIAQLYPPPTPPAPAPVAAPPPTAAPPPAKPAAPPPKKDETPVAAPAPAKSETSPPPLASAPAKPEAPLPPASVPTPAKSGAPPLPPAIAPAPAKSEAPLPPPASAPAPAKSEASQPPPASAPAKSEVLPPPTNAPAKPDAPQPATAPTPPADSSEGVKKTAEEKPAAPAPGSPPTEPAKKDAPAAAGPPPAEPAKKTESAAPSTPPVSFETPAAQKSTLRMIRNFFKPEPTERP